MFYVYNGELDGISFTRDMWDGNHPNVWQNRTKLDIKVAKLCARLQKLDVTKYSLEKNLLGVLNL